METSIQQQIMEAQANLSRAKAEREKRMSYVFDERNKLKKNANPAFLKMYYRAHDTYMKAQAEVARLEGLQRKEILEAKLAAMNLSVGETYFYPRTGTSGILEVDNYGYAMLNPVSQKNPHIAKFSNKIGLNPSYLIELQPVQKKGA